MSPEFTQRILPFAAFLVALSIALAIRHVLLNLGNRVAKDRFTFLPMLIRAVRIPSILWCLALAISIAIRTTNPTAGQSWWATRLIGAFFTLSISLVVAAAMVRTITAYGERHKAPGVLAGLSRTLPYILTLTIAALMLMELFDINITPLLTAFGVGGLAVALALQDTMANFFAGIHILIEEPIAIGDSIKLSTGEEGVVRDIGWRTTRLHTPNNNITVIPNTKITSGILTNFSLPDKRASAEVILYAAHDAEPDRIAEIALEEAVKIPRVLTEPPPTVMFDPGILLTHMQMKIVVHLADKGHTPGVQSELRAAIFRRFREQGIPLPETNLK